MKQIILTILTGCLIAGPVYAQPGTREEARDLWGAGALSFHVSSLVANTPLVFNAEVFAHSGRSRVSFGTGMSYNFLIVFDEELVGPHLTIGLWTGQTNHHFEMKGGAAFLFQSDGEYSFTMPIITMGYRNQKPGGGTFFRIDIGTGGLGVGYGWLLR